MYRIRSEYSTLQLALSILPAFAHSIQQTLPERTASPPSPSWETPREGAEKERREPVAQVSIDALLRSDDGTTNFTYLEMAANFSKRKLTSMRGLDAFSRLREVDLSHNNLGKSYSIIYSLLLLII